MIRKHRRHLESTILNYLNVLFYLLKNAYKSRYFFNGKYYSEYKRMHRKPKKKKRGNEQITGWSLLNSLFFFFKMLQHGLYCSICAQKMTTTNARIDAHTLKTINNKNILVPIDNGKGYFNLYRWFLFKNQGLSRFAL